MKITLENLSLQYGGNTVVKDLDLQIADGESLVLLGQSGCGKTSTMRCIAGLEHPSAGRITIGDAPADRLTTLNAETGNVSGVAELIFGRYVWVFEATSALLITAALAAMVLAHRERITPKTGQAALAALFEHHLG